MNSGSSAGRLGPLLDYLGSLDGRADLDVLSGLPGDIAVTRAELGSACRFGAESYERNRIADHAGDQGLAAGRWHRGFRPAPERW